jgi:hypothetical protein
MFPTRRLPFSTFTTHSSRSALPISKSWNETAAPILNGAMEDGILGGWVREGHNTGGRYNWKVLYLFEEWDHIDDLFERLVSQLMADAELWQKLGRMIAAHDDIIWTSVPEPGM